MEELVIGENMSRVSEYASRIGAGTLKGTSIEAIRAEIRLAKEAGKEIIDIGPDFGRRLERNLQGVQPDSSVYNAERMEAGEAARGVFERSGKFQGGVRGLDF